MTTKGVKRKLTAILSADVKGYSRLMGEDEEATVRILTAYREVMASLIEQYRGRVVDSPGDNLLAEFASVVDAVQCAVEIQQVLKARNAELPENRRMEFRVGINLGDVIEEEERIYGDGVNIAARVEGLAEAGGICISGSAYEQIKNKLAFGYEYLGEHSVKNIAEPVRVYRTQIELGAKRAEKKAPLRRWQWAALAVVGILVIGAGAVAIWNFYLRHAPPVEVTPEREPALELPDKPSIAVLPFVNMSGDPEQEYFSDGITEDIITNLSKVSGILVISRNSSFLYKGKQVKIQEVAKDLGVRYVLEGSVRRAGDKLRITAQLIDVKTDHHVWAERYDRKLRDIFAVQDEVTEKVVSELAVTLKASESERLARKHTENFEAYDLHLRARKEFFALKKENILRAQELSKRVIELDPHLAGGYARLSYMLSVSVRHGHSTSPREDVEKALELAQKAVSVDDTYWLSYQALASAYLMKGRHDDALAAATAAVRIQPGNSEAHLWLGFCLHWMGRGEEALQALKMAQELNPKYLSSGLDFPGYLDFPGFASFTAGRYEQCIAAMKKAIDRLGPFVLRQAFLAASYSELSRNEEARAMAQQLLQTNPNFALKSWKFARVYKNPEDTERLLNALRRAGLK
jgi:adenylate cyclase